MLLRHLLIVAGGEAVVTLLIITVAAAVIVTTRVLDIVGRLTLTCHGHAAINHVVTTGVQRFLYVLLHAHKHARIPLVILNKAVYKELRLPIPFPLFSEGDSRGRKRALFRCVVVRIVPPFLHLIIHLCVWFHFACSFI